MLFEIKSRWTGSVLFSLETMTLKRAVQAAVSQSAHLRGADLRGADLGSADLRGANLRGAHLGDADLGSAHLRDADLTPIRDDLWAVLSAAPKEATGLRQALIDGKVDGSAYEGACACLVGTIANLCGLTYTTLPLLKPNSHRPAERFFLGINKGDTVETSQFVKLAVEWIDVWLANMREAFGKSDTAAASTQEG